MSKQNTVSLFVLAAVRVASAATTPTQDNAYGHLPLAFERNEGQQKSCTDFVALGANYNLGLSSDAAVLSVRGGQNSPGTTLRMKLAGARHDARPALEAPLPGVSNYFTGSNASQWHTGIPNYSRINYRGVYPGVDLVYYGNQQQLEYDFVVAAGADPSVIDLDFDGASTARLNSTGDLELVVGDRTLVQHKPVIYQQINGERRAVEGGYRVQGSHVRFAVSKYDRSRPLVIDPVLSYSTYFGGKDFNEGNSIAVDAQGNAYLTGFLYVEPGAASCGHDSGDPATHSHGSLFVAKLSADGKRMLYSTVLGGSSQDVGYGIAVDSSGSAYVTGYTRSDDFPTTHGAIQNRLAKGATQNAFVSRLDARGGLSYSTYLGGSGSDEGRSIAVDAHSRAYLTGYTSSQNFPTSSHAYQRSLNGLQNVFVTRLNANGNGIDYSTLLGGDNYDFGFGIAVGQDGSAFVTGATHAIFSSTFPVTRGAYQTTMAGSGDAFVSRISADGSKLLYSTFLGGTGYDGARGIAVDANNTAYVTGFTQSTEFPTTPGALQPALNGQEDVFVTKLSADGSQLVYSTYLGGSGNDASYGIAVTNKGVVSLTGFTQSADFPTTAGAIQLPSAATRLPFVASINAAGSQLSYSTCLGGSNSDGAHAIALDSSGNAFVTGYTRSVDFPVTTRALENQLNPNATQDAFVTKLLITQ